MTTPFVMVVTTFVMVVTTLSPVGHGWLIKTRQTGFVARGDVRFAFESQSGSFFAS